MQNRLCGLLSGYNISFTENELMSTHTSFRIGGIASVFAVPETEKQLCLAVDACRSTGTPYTVLGKGSNVLFDDSGYNGAVISTEKLNAVRLCENVISCGCGASFTQTAVFARDNSLAGLEFAYGIPGAVGGAVFMNAGAYGGEVSQVLCDSTYYDTASGKIYTIESKEHNFGYRECVYREHPERIILSARFKLACGDKTNIKEKMDGYMESRRTKQPLEFPSAGSVFKRCQGHYTGQMIEELGLKGYTVGGAQVSQKHAGFIINRGGATSADVLKLIDIIKEKVLNSYGLELQCEIIHIK